MEGLNLSELVSTKEAYIVEPADHGFTGEVELSVAAIDLGIKEIEGRLELIIVETVGGTLPELDDVE